MEYLKKGTFGYSVLKDSNKTEATHIAVEKDEYRKNEQSLKTIPLLNKKIDEQNKFLEEYKNDYIYLKYKNDDLQNKLKEFQNTIESLKSKLEEVEAYNVYLAQKAREKANSNRRIVPKKMHTGYVFKSMSPIDYKYKKDGKLLNLKCYKTVFQTPFDIDLNYDTVFNQCIKDFIDYGYKGMCLADKIGIDTEVYLNDYVGLYNYIDMKNKKVNKDNFGSNYDRIYKEIKESELNKNYIIDPQLRQNGLTDYWEFSFLHVYELNTVPTDMRIRRRKKKGEEPPKEDDTEQNDDEII